MARIERAKALAWFLSPCFEGKTMNAEGTEAVISKTIAIAVLLVSVLRMRDGDQRLSRSWSYQRLVLLLFS